MLSFGLFPMVKVLVSILVVVLLSLIAEHAGPRVAGVVSGYPLGAAISLLFIGIEISPAFAARSAGFTAAGLTGSALACRSRFAISAASLAWAVSTAPAFWSASGGPASPAERGERWRRGGLHRAHRAPAASPGNR